MSIANKFFHWAVFGYFLGKTLYTQCHFPPRCIPGGSSEFNIERGGEEEGGGGGVKENPVVE